MENCYYRNVQIFLIDEKNPSKQEVCAFIDAVLDGTIFDFVMEHGSKFISYCIESTAFSDIKLNNYTILSGYVFTDDGDCQYINICSNEKLWNIRCTNVLLSYDTTISVVHKNKLSIEYNGNTTELELCESHKNCAADSECNIPIKNILFKRNKSSTKR